MRQVITADFGKIRLGEDELPGIFTRIRVKGSVRVDEVRVPGASGRSKQPLGFDDAEVTVTIRLQNDEKSDPYQKLKQLAALFRSVDEHAKPRVYRVVNKHTDAWGIQEVIYKDLSTSEDNSDDTIQAELHFLEYMPVMVQREQRAVETREPQPGTEQAFALDQQAEGPPGTIDGPAVDDDEV